MATFHISIIVLLLDTAVWRLDAASTTTKADTTVVTSGAKESSSFTPAPIFDPFKQKPERPEPLFIDLEYWLNLPDGSGDGDRDGDGNLQSSSDGAPVNRKLERSNEADDHNISMGVIIGLSVCGVLVLCAVGLAIALFVVRKKKAKPMTALEMYNTTFRNK